MIQYFSNLFGKKTIQFGHIYSPSSGLYTQKKLVFMLRMLTVCQWNQGGTHSRFRKKSYCKVWKYFLWKLLSVKIQEEFKSRSKTDKFCCHSVQDLVYSSIISNYIMVKIKRIVNIFLLASARLILPCIESFHFKSIKSHEWSKVVAQLFLQYCR